MERDKHFGGCEGANVEWERTILGEIAKTSHRKGLGKKQDYKMEKSYIRCYKDISNNAKIIKAEVSDYG